MRILTVRQPWAWALMHAGKDVENRARNLAGDYRGPVAIHVAKSYAPAITVGGPLTDAMHAAIDDGTATWNNEPWWAGAGNIIGVLELTDVHHGPEYGGGCHKLRSPLPVTPRYELCSPWGEADTYHLVFANPRPLPTPIPYHGALGLRTLPDDIIDQITTALAAEGAPS